MAMADISDIQKGTPINFLIPIEATPLPCWPIEQIQLVRVIELTPRPTR